MDSKMTTITAAEFVSEGYAAKIAAGECTVKSPLYSEPIISAENVIKQNSESWDVAITDTRSTYRTYSNVELWVTWLPQPATASEDTAPTGAGVDYQTMWFSAAKQLAELRVDYDELFKELDEAPPQSLVVEQQTELTSLRAKVATLNAAIADYVDGCDGVGGSYEQARKSFDVLYEIRNRE